MVKVEGLTRKLKSRERGERRELQVPKDSGGGKGGRSIRGLRR